MGLPEAYSGEIYLTGCNTARGDNDGYMGAFYSAIVKHSPHVRVRGNVAPSTTFPDGTQGVWAGVFESEARLKEMERLYLDEAAKIKERIEEDRKGTDAACESMSEGDRIRAKQLFVTRTAPKLAKMRRYLEKRNRLQRAAYSTDLSLTRTLPK